MSLHLPTLAVSSDFERRMTEFDALNFLPSAQGAVRAIEWFANEPDSVRVFGADVCDLIRKVVVTSVHDEICRIRLLEYWLSARHSVQLSLCGLIR
ncbi:hypothetical protein BT96DRAFT_1010324 [Gymnopus androsaceus JB14]|uniref:Uncharacterized protein n=1 Tax=Gymnopus androsaceus JB14 TaxID=1447944 RepID=A0A6A4GAV3_9AGAR|nr:hypothetical protein BT96DRAFT_1010324 [Gymnopus androsaceus JB14]